LKWFNNLKLKLSHKVVGLVIFESVFLFLIGFVGYHYSKAGARYKEELLTLALIFMAVVLSTVLGLFIVHIIIDPLYMLTEKMKEVAKGNFFIEPAEIEGHDEFAEQYLAFNAMTSNLRNFVTKEQAVKDREAFLKQIMIASITSLDIKDTIHTLVTKTGKFFKADRCIFTAYDPLTQEHFPIMDYGVYLSSLRIKTLAGLKLTKEQMQPIIKFVFGQKEVLVIDNVNEVDIPESLRELIKEYSIKSYLSAPVIYQGTPLGRFSLHYINDYKKFNQDDIDLILAIASQSAISIHQTKLYSEIEEIKNRESLLRTIISNTLLSTSIKDAMKTMSTEIGKLFNADKACFLLFDNTLQNFSEIEGEYRRSEDILSTEGKIILQKDLEQLLIEELFIKKKVLILNSNSQCPKLFRSFLEHLSLKAAIIVPIFYNDKPIAALLVKYTESTKQLSKEELDFLIPIAQQISIGINLFQANEKLIYSVNTERTIKDIVLETRKLKDYNKIWDYFLDRITEIYSVDRAINLCFTPEGNLSICNEVIKNIDQASSLGQDISNIENTGEILPDESGQIVIINDINTEIKDPVLKEYFRNKKTYSLLLYPITSRYLTREQIVGIIMLCSSAPRKWTSNEVDSFKLAVDTTNLVYLEIKQRQETDDQKKTFLATLTHDLRSPLLAEQKALEAILSKKLGISLENYAEYLEDMYKTNDELLRIVNNLLMTYHYESGISELELKPGNIEDIIDHSVKLMKPLAKDNNSEIITVIQPDLPLIMTNADEISRVITNLINNAIKHNPKGINVNIDAKNVDNELLVSVSDNGKGIPESERPNIFQKYPTTKRKIGSGLGLYLSKQIINAHKGRIWFETEEGKGTTFYFTLPVT
jgi:signal transduction histidine kinase